MGIEDFSSAAQWAPLARHALKQEARRRGGDGKGRKNKATTPVADITALALPLQLNV